MLDLFRMLSARRLWWLAPPLAIMIAFGALLAFGNAYPVLAPFIYAIF